jgi:hypothetical protein
LRKKEKKKEEFAKFVEDNIELQKHKQRLKEAEAQLELKMQREYAERLDAQERARNATYEQTYERQRRFMAMNEKNVQSGLAEKARQEEERARRQQEEMYARMDQVEAEKRQKRLEEKQNMLRTLELQRQIREEQKMREREEEQQLGQKLRQIGQEEEQKRRLLAMRKKELQKKNYVDLQGQMELAQRMKVEAVMTETEKKLNKHLLGEMADENEQDLMNMSY